MDLRNTMNLCKLYYFALIASCALCALFSFLIFQFSPSHIIAVLATLSMVFLVIILHLSYLLWRLVLMYQKSNINAMNTSQTVEVNTEGLNALANTMINLHARLGQNLCFLKVSVDDFNAIVVNDGEKVAQQTLMNIYQLWISSLRETDIISRFGECEFLILLPNTVKDEGYRLAEGVRLKLEDASLFSPKVSISMGCVGLRKGEDYEAVVKRANEALTCAVKGGKNRTVVS